VRAVYARGGRLVVEEIAEPTPGEGHVLVRPAYTGICGSDLHALHIQAEDPVAVPAMVFGHEFCAEVLDYGPGTAKKFPVGSLVCSVPFIDGPEGPELVGLTPNYFGGFAERMLLQEQRLIPVPNGLSAQRAALTEPLAVGVHAVAQADLEPGDVPLVLGCGPIGLAVIAALRVRGQRPIIASDFSAKRRQLAEQAGADIVINPAEASPYTTWLEMAGAPLPPSPLVLSGAIHATHVVFDCAGAPGLLAQFIELVPSHSRLIVAGVCAVPDTFVPVRAIEKELTMKYVFAYRPEEFAYSLSLIAEGKVDVDPWITGTVNLDGVAAAFDALGSPDQHCKVLVSPNAG